MRVLVSCWPVLGQLLRMLPLARAGAGLSLPPEVLTAGAVADDASRLLTQTRFTESAQRVKADLDAMPSPDEVLAGLLHDAAVN